ncbi:helix-turn-helix domain-containing protein [Curtobacterium sp. VKM Ac-2884]|uniref:helix-turn-helix domain-containing protein n=1 Tax=Curtobacterium sp. VKM Ac-2884 TaxID=2783818 RepID=UPI00188CB6A7|nr:helix-turn-helix transcriptional regulator [Curtobacterium sp. VKM Ac-2884]MBF4604154.1 helix-turn-helix domain-containing protein [Curtobacterium sp. VKM Ac-2884]
MSEFASVLRSWRDRVRPEEVGLPAGPGRRTPGLRREELAALAGVSVDYVVRLEQGRALNPSPQLLGALATALRLTAAERDHLCRVAGVAPPSLQVVPRHITPGVQRLVDRLGDVPIAVFTATHDIVLWNDLWAALNGDPSRAVGIERNLVWRHFMHAHDGVEWDDEHQEEFSSDLAADLRQASGRYPADRDLSELVARLRRDSPEFERRWDTGRIAEHRASRKQVRTPVGPIEIDCDVLTVPGGDLRIVVYTAVPGTEDAAKLDLLRVTGLQQFTTAP